MQQPALGASTSKKEAPPGSSVLLQTFLYFDHYYSAIFFILEYLIYIYKGFSFVYPSGVLAIEIVALTFFLFYQYVRLYFGSVGNKTESSKDTVLFLALSIPAIIGFIFYLRLQIYTLLLEVVLNSIGLVFSGFEVLLAIYAMTQFKAAEKYH